MPRIGRLVRAPALVMMHGQDYRRMRTISQRVWSSPIKQIRRRKHLLPADTEQSPSPIMGRQRLYIPSNVCFIWPLPALGKRFHTILDHSRSLGRGCSAVMPRSTTDRSSPPSQNRHRAVLAPRHHQPKYQPVPAAEVPPPPKISRHRGRSSRLPNFARKQPRGTRSGALKPTNMIENQVFKL